ncbi:hypothetical protein [Mucilaginibacter sp. FT3.2]|uniref:hypothetical protein n=1 Tax=Mucilaginibacter sp. FT3.2 TaxID=2723090 RepID=UPI0016230657|nr:hypothetical protein [Mucilaginibacter sp. FT3.2]MBB6230039.1 uncharacterized protein YneF (UPF0154 family) [Mucilaginibacter sp. FT3.2]
MNWKLIFQLSLFGLVMGIATVYFIPSNAEFFFWLPIFILNAYFIAKSCADSHFSNGFMIGIVNSVWIAAAHIIFYDAYLVHHVMEARLYNNPTIPVPPKAAMFIIGLVTGVASGLVIGLFAFIASKIVRNKKVLI